MKFNNIKLGKILPMVIFGLGILTTVLSNKNDALSREQLKNEIKEELRNEFANTNV